MRTLRRLGGARAAVVAAVQRRNRLAQSRQDRVAEPPGLLGVGRGGALRQSAADGRQQPAQPAVRGLVLSRAHGYGARGDVKRRFALWRARPQFLACDVRDLPYPLTVRARAEGVPVYAWTVRTPAQEGIAARSRARLAGWQLE